MGDLDRVETMHYRILNSTTGSALIIAYGNEADAIKAAEQLAHSSPGNEYVVLKAVAKSIAAKPVTTTRF